MDQNLIGKLETLVLVLLTNVNEAVNRLDSEALYHLSAMPGTIKFWISLLAEDHLPKSHLPERLQ